MGEIPDDVFAVAGDLVNEIIRNYERSVPANRSRDAVAIAILSERQSCVDACLRLADHQKKTGALREAFTSEFIASELEAGNHHRYKTD